MRDLSEHDQQRTALHGALNPRFDVRNIVSRSSATIRGRLSCRKAKGGAKIESTWEAAFCLRAEASADVRSFETNPFQIELSPGGPNYTPDALVDDRERGLCLVEVKPRRYLKRPDTLVRLMRIRQEVEARGYQLLFSTDVELNHRAENARMRSVKIYRRVYTARETASLAGRVASEHVMTMGQAEQMLGSRAAVMHLIAMQYFFVDYRRPFDANTVIARNPMEANHAVALFSPW